MSNICVLPFNSLSISSIGELRVCCNSSGSGFDIFLKDLTLPDALNNDKIIEIRKSFLTNNRHSDCDRCWKMEDGGSSSFRLVANNDSEAGTINAINLSEKIDFKDLHYLDITIGNKCNLACRMCSPYSSSLVYKQWQKIGLKNINDNPLIDHTDDVKRKILDILDKSVNLKKIYVLGGEPLISDFHDDIIDILIKNGRSKNITLQYNTNLQVDVEKHLEKWKFFKNIFLNVSLDGSNETYEYVRWPGSWNKIVSNVNSLNLYSLQYSNIKIGVSTTIQNLNVDNIYDLISDIRSLTADKFPFFFIPVVGQNEIDIIETSIITQEKTKFKNLENKVFRINELLSMLEDAEHRSKNLTEERVQQFFSMQEKLDKLRNQNLFRTKPHFETLAKKFNISVWN